jgi:hypothetical protein
VVVGERGMREKRKEKYNKKYKKTLASGGCTSK